MSLFESILELLGLLKPAGAPVAAMELAPWVSVSAAMDGIAAGTYVLQPSFNDLAALRAHTSTQVVIGGAVKVVDHVSGLISAGLLRGDPNDATKFQLSLNLRVGYPAAAGNANAVAGNGLLPVVLLNHGHHDSWVATGGYNPVGANKVQPATFDVHKSYQGYAYLQDALSAKNIISVSVDHNFAGFAHSLIETRANLIVAALEALKAEAGNPASRFAGRLDFTRIGLMGHSRGGEAVVAAAKKISASAALSANYQVKAVCSLAPTDFSGAGTTPAAPGPALAAGDTAFYHVLYGALDGDVSGTAGAHGPVGTGFRHYDRAQCSKSMVFLDACCHDFFNTLWASEPAERGLADPRLAKASVHQDIAIDYLGDLYQWQLAGVALPQRFDGRSGNRAAMHASSQWMFGTALKRIDDFEQATNLLGGARTVNSVANAPAALQDMAKVAVPAVGTLENNTGHCTTVLHVDLTAAASPPSTTVLVEAIPAPDKNWSTFDTLILSLAGWFDPTSQTTINAANLPRIKITLTDGANKSAVLDWNSYGSGLPSRPVFKVLPTDTGGSENLTLMRLETIPVALSGFTGVDLTQVASISLDVEPGNATHVFVDNLHVLKR